MAELAQQYRPDEHEPAVYRQWEKAGAFAPRPDAAGEPFVIMLPPPNITGSLHMGHALQDTIMDILIRWRRMQGRPTLWLPGTDHAAIATNRVLENQLRQEGTSRTAIGRERYLKRAAQWYREVGDTIVNQMKRLGCSCDWSRIRFTMDQPYIAAVQAAFVRYYQRGYIYRGNRLVNWCPSCASVVSDLEVVYREADTELVTLRYPLTDGGHTISVATTRPETMLGDTAVAVHPDDKRYQSLIGRTAVLPLVGRKIPVIADARVDPAFGTGAVKVTPAHDALDAAIGETHRLPAIKIIGEDGLLTDAAGQFAGLPAASARAAVLHALERDGVASERRTFKHSISLCDRCGHVIEPLLSRQWFVAMNKLKNETISTAANLISFIPQRWRKHFITWMENVHDWTISRQLWLGQSVPAWWRPGARGTANEAGNYVVSIVKPGSNSGLPAEDSGKGWEPDPDTLDTWFSSAIWPLATLGWPAATDDLARYYPTSVLVTARDILYLWVARMVFSGLELMPGPEFGGRHPAQRIPFKHVFIHPTVLTKTGQRMSKSLGTGLDPQGLINTYGADATRFGLMYQMSFDNQAIRFDEEAVKSARNFTNKLWNIARLLDKLAAAPRPAASATIADRWIEQRFSATLASTDQLLAHYRIGEAARGLYEFVWRDLADWYMEILKIEGSLATAQQLWRDTLKILHPFMPHLTEVLWGHIGESELLITAAWPVPPSPADQVPAAAVARFQDIVGTVRRARTLFGVPPSAALDLAMADPPLPAALSAMCRARLLPAASRHMKRLPLDDGTVIALASDAITAASLARARRQLAASEKKVRAAITHLKKTLAAMRVSAPPDAVAKKTAALESARAKLHGLAQSKKLL